VNLKIQTDPELGTDTYRKQVRLQYLISQILLSDDEAHGVTRSAGGMRRATRQILEAFAEEFDWSLGQFWQQNDDGTLSLGACWHDGSPQLLELLTLDTNTCVECDRGLVGSTFVSGQTVFVTNVPPKFSPARREAIKRAGIHAALLYPLGNSGVLLFLSTKVKPASESNVQTESIQTIGRQISLFLDSAGPRGAYTAKRPEGQAGNAAAIGGVMLDKAHYALRGPHGSAPLTRIEWELMSVLFQRRGSVVLRHQLLDQVWGQTGIADSTALHDAICRLRKRLRAVGAADNLIQSVRGFGYMLRTDRANGEAMPN